MDISRNEKRTTKRHAVRLHCQVVRLKDFSLLADEVHDLSSGGLKAPVERRVLTGEPVILTVRDPVSGRWFDAEGSVARVSHGRRRGETGSRTIGVSFDLLKGSDQGSFETWLQTLPPALPAQ